MEQIKVKKAVTHETWHRIEVQILRDEYGVSTIDEISKKIPRHTKRGIYQKAKSLGLMRKQIDPKEYHNPQYSKMSIKEQAIEMGVSYAAVWEHTTKKGRYYKK
jgi:hypothetical protein